MKSGFSPRLACASSYQLTSVIWLLRHPRDEIHIDIALALGIHLATVFAFKLAANEVERCRQKYSPAQLQIS